MNKIARMEPAQRAELFAETANRLDMPEALIEKDFWVCWVLKQFFSIKQFSGRFLFKGGNRCHPDSDAAIGCLRLTPAHPPLLDDFPDCSQKIKLALVFLDVATMAVLLVIGNLVFRHFEPRKPLWRRPLKIFALLAMTAVISYCFGGIGVAIGFGIAAIPLIYVHAIWLPRNGVNGCTGELREKYYALRGWAPPERGTAIKDGRTV